MATTIGLWTFYAPITRGSTDGRISAPLAALHEARKAARRLLRMWRRRSGTVSAFLERTGPGLAVLNKFLCHRVCMQFPIPTYHLP